MKRLALVGLLPGCFLFHHKQSASCQEGRTVDLSLPEDVKKFAGCERAAGIRIRTGAEIDVTPLSDLEEITGDLSIGPTVGVDTVAFNGLIRVGGTIRVADNGSLRGLFLPRLEKVGRIEVDNNAVLSTISLPRLATVEGSLVITDNTSLEMLTTTMLTDIGQELVISGHPKLELLEMPRIAHMQTIRLESNPRLPPNAVEALTSKADVDQTAAPNLGPPPAKDAGSGAGSAAPGGAGAVAPSAGGSGAGSGAGSGSSSAAPP
ncbi:MAG TPA: hypothetical protein VLB44_25195 [Kofleriaceae bacterium]|nr:hypothetical protein [Kofleriaceae bacterium]